MAKINAIIRQDKFGSLYEPRVYESTTLIQELSKEFEIKNIGYYTGDPKDINYTLLPCYNVVLKTKARKSKMIEMLGNMFKKNDKLKIGFTILKIE